MEIRDILWPPTCAVLSIDSKHALTPHHAPREICAGDVLHLHYQTYDPERTMQTLIAILGEQPENPQAFAHAGSDEHLVPPLD